MKKEGLPDSVLELVRWAAKLHDLGKLQDAWQTWAHERQNKMGRPAPGALAKTDYDWDLHRREPRPPHHASASALYGAQYLASLSTRDQSAILLAVLAHHGGTLKGVERADKLHANAVEAIAEVGLNSAKPISHQDFQRDQSDTIRASFLDTWPLVAIVSRVLRLSDQQATADSQNG